MLGCLNDYDRARPLEGCAPVGVSDDQGLYLYLPLLADVAGLDSAEEALRWMYITLFAVLALVSPLIFYGLFKSLLAALVAPAAIVFHFDLFVDTDIYWISGWCYLLAVPLLLLVYERWGRYSPLLLAGVVAIGSFATSIRIHTGLPILLGALIVAVLRRRSLPSLLATAAVVCVAYFSFAALLMGVREYRDHAVGDPGLSERYPTRHPFWHNAYIGSAICRIATGSSGTTRSRSNWCARRIPRPATSPRGTSRSCATSGSASPARIPGSSGVTCSRSSVSDSTRPRPLRLVLLLLPFALFIGSARSRWRRWLLILAPALLLSLPPSLLTMPLSRVPARLGRRLGGSLALAHMLGDHDVAGGDPLAPPGKERPYGPVIPRTKRCALPPRGSRSGSWRWSRSSRTSSDRGRPTTSPWPISIASEPVRCARRHATMLSRSGRFQTRSRTTGLRPKGPH